MRKLLLTVMSLSIVLIAFGCAHQQSSEVGTDLSALQQQVNQKESEIRQLETTTQQQQAELENYRKQLEQQSTGAAARAETSDAYADAMLLPPDAKPGECYARLYIPPTFTTTDETVLKRGASEKLEIIPAKYEWAEERVLVTAASERLEVIPAQYEWVEEQVLVQEASSRIEEVPARYEMQEEKIMVKPAQTVWKKGRGPIEKIDNATGEIMCLVETPAIYKTVKKNVMVSPPTTREIAIPAEYKTVKKQVMAKAPTTRTIEIPATYRTVKVKKMVSEPQTRKIEIPAEYQTVTKTEMVKDGHMEWRKILCETNVSPDFIKKFQAALMRSGHNPGPIDGVIGQQTEAAMKAYQREKGLAVGAVTYETVKSLGITTM
jgi:cell division protein FtsB